MGRIGKTAIAMVLSLGAFPALAINDDAQCLAYGKLGAFYANLREQGEPESFALRIAEGTRDKGNKPEELDKLVKRAGSGTRQDLRKANEEVYRGSLNIISYIYTVGLKPDDARKMIYLKCKAGDLA